MNFDNINDLNWGVAQANTTPAIFAENTYEVRDTVTKTWGSHTIRTGFEYRIEQDNSDLAGASRPVYAFQGLWNFANDAPIYEGITANPNTGGPALSQRYFRDHYWGLFVQHDWKATPNLTLNMGLRWEYFEPLYNQGFKINYPILGPGRQRGAVDRRYPGSAQSPLEFAVEQLFAQGRFRLHSASIQRQHCGARRLRDGLQSVAGRALRQCG